MSNIQYLIKFGERKYMERLAAGYLYFSNAVKLREHETKLKTKGQGDRLEGASQIFAQNITMQSLENPHITIKLKQADIITLQYASAEKIPVFCLFSCMEKDCVEVTATASKIVLDKTIKEDISSHFKKADTAVIIHNPPGFIKDIETAFNGTCMMNPVNYFHVEGFPTEDGRRSLDGAYVEYLTQDTPPGEVNGSQISIGSDYAYRSLLCKDVFFANEQEFRLILPEQKIEEPNEFFVSYAETKTSVVSLSDLFNDKVIITC